MAGDSFAVWNRLARLGALLALGACTAQEFTVRDPDGSERSFRHIELHPKFVVRPDQVEIRPAGATDDGFPVEEIVRRDGKGGRYFRVQPPFGEPLFFREVPKPRPGPPRARPGTTVDEAPEPIFPEFAPGAELRVTAQLDPEFATLEARVEGGAWTPVAHGSFERVALAAAAHGMEPLEFTNELGSWRVDIDGRFPMATVRLEGSVVEVRGLR